jgi:hypothetical protein
MSKSKQLGKVLVMPHAQARRCASMSRDFASRAKFDNVVSSRFPLPACSTVEFVPTNLNLDNVNYKIVQPSSVFSQNKVYLHSSPEL